MGKTIELNESSYEYLVQILQERYYSTNEVEELQKINEINKALGEKSEEWLALV